MEEGKGEGGGTFALEGGEKPWDQVNSLLIYPGKVEAKKMLEREIRRMLRLAREGKGQKKEKS